MPFRDDNHPFSGSLKWDDVFDSATEFISKVVSVGGITDTDDLTELYEILANKYYTAHTRYTDPFAFIFAIKRELYVEFPYYLEKKDLANEIINLTDAEIELQRVQLRNLVDTHDDPVTDAPTVAIEDLSTQQENIRQTLGKLSAKRAKYNSLKADYLQNIYKKCDGLFRQILAEDIITLYEE